jgi:mono/diheme cytochrome c family protein
MIRRGVVLFGVMLLMLVTIAACGPDSDELVQAGETIYISNCGRCHAQDGSGYDPLYPALDGNPIVTLHDTAPVVDIVLHGQGSMMGFRDSLDDVEIAAVISYIRQAWSNDAPPIEPRQVQGAGDPNGELPDGPNGENDTEEENGE